MRTNRQRGQGSRFFLTIGIIAIIRLGAGGLGTLRGALAAPSAVITVNSAADNLTAGDGFCTLREALTNANQIAGGDTTAGDCTGGTAGADTIEFAAGLDETPIVLTLGPSGDDANLNGDLDILDHLTLTGNGPRSTIIDGDNLYRVFDIVNGGLTIRIDDLTIRNGSELIVGGAGINNSSSTVTINNSAISGNSASAGAGVRHAGGTLTITDSTLSGNSATGSGGAITTAGGTVNLNNSTLSGNSAAASGGAILNAATVNHFNVTFSGNSAGSGGSINNTGTVSLQNSIITDSTGGDCAGVGLSGSNNLIDDTSCGAGAGRLAAVSNFNATLDDNGGANQSHALSTGSNAIDTGVGNCPDHLSNPLTMDQRGVPRADSLAAGSTCDIGAFEYVNAIGSAGSGPGGVGAADGSSTLEVWYRADGGVFDAETAGSCSGSPIMASGSSVVCWEDQSGNGQHASQAVVANQPSYITGILNNGSEPVIRFDGASGHFLGSSAVPATGANPRAILGMIVNGVDSGLFNYQHIAHYGNGGLALRQSYGMAFRTYPLHTGGGSNIGNHYWLNGWESTQTQSANPLILNIQYDGTQDQLFVNGNSAGTNTVALNTGSTNSLQIGSRQDGAGDFLTGDLAEVIVFGASLNSVQRVLVENYMQAKFNDSTVDDLAIASDYFGGDTSANGDFDLDVGGIAQIGGQQNTIAHSAGMIVRDRSFLIDNGDTLLMGHRNAANGNTTSDLPAGGGWGGANDQRWVRHWYIDLRDDATNSGGKVDIIFDFSEAGMGPPDVPDTPVNNYRLLKRTGASGAFSDITLSSGAVVAIVGDQVQFLGVDVTQLGSNFTLGSLDAVQSPTAVTVHSQTAYAQDLLGRFPGIQGAAVLALLAFSGMMLLYAIGRRTGRSGQD